MGPWSCKDAPARWGSEVRNHPALTARGAGRGRAYSSSAVEGADAAVGSGGEARGTRVSTGCWEQHSAGQGAELAGREVQGPPTGGRGEFQSRLFQPLCVRALFLKIKYFKHF